MKTLKKRVIHPWCAAVMVAMVGGAPASAQLASTVPAAGGMADNYTAVARGYSAVSWNPSALGLATGQSSSATVAAFRALAGIGPVTLADLKSYEGENVPADVRLQWLADIRREGGQTGAGGFDVTWAAFQFGRVGAMVSTSARALNDISPGMAELILFGNADEQGNPRSIELAGSNVDSHMYSTAAVGFGVPVPLPGGRSRLALGATAKYTIGHALAVTEPSVGRATDDPVGLTIRFPIAYTPVVHSGTSYWIRSGGGFGVDVALSFESGPLVLSAVGQNVFTTFEWDHERMRYRPLELVFSEATVETASEWEPMSNAPEALKARVAAATFNPSLNLGAAYRSSRTLLVAADARFGSTDGMATRPPVHAGAGVEVRPLSWLPLQAGAAYISLGEERSGVQFGGGLGLELGNFHVSASVARRNVGLGAETMVMVSLLSHSF
jgi:hypothetical protein